MAALLTRIILLEKYDFNQLNFAGHTSGQKLYNSIWPDKLG